MPNQKKAKAAETAELEAQLRNMILGNVTFGDNQQPNKLQHSNQGSQRNNNGPHQGPYSPQSPQFPQRGRGRGMPPHIRQKVEPRGSGPVLMDPNESRPPVAHQQLWDGGRRGGNNFRPPPSAPSIDLFVAQCEYLDRVASVEIPKVQMTQVEFVEKETFRTLLERTSQLAFRREFPNTRVTLSLECFGSISSGFATAASDVDLALVMHGEHADGQEHEPTLSRVEIARLLERALLDLGIGARLLAKTRVPILKVCERPTAELYRALCDERQKWDEVPDAQKYATTTPGLEHVEPGPELDLSPPNPDDMESTEKAVMDMGEKSNSDNQGKRSNKWDHVRRIKDGLNTLSYMSAQGAIDPYEIVKESSALLQSAHEIQEFAERRGSTVTSVTQLTVLLGKLQEDHAITSTFLESAFSDLAMIERFCRECDVKAQKDRDANWTREKQLGPLDFPKVGVGIQADINFSNPLALHNTSLLRCYSLTDPRVRPMVLFVKAWAKRRKINSSRFGTLSSYGYVLMVIHFLVNIAQPPVCPNLQSPHMYATAETWTEQPPPELNVEGYDVRFWSDEAAIQALVQGGGGSRNVNPLGVLLRNFFNYYAAQGRMVIGNGFNWTQEVLSLRTPGGIKSKQEKGWTGAKSTTVENREVRHRYLFAIEDPFEIDHNVARTVTHHGIVAVRDEFRRAWRILSSIGRGEQPEGDLFDEVVEKLGDPLPVQA